MADKSLSPEYRAWASMIARCENKGHPDYATYGGRGIGVDPKWRADFDAFKKAIGPRPSSAHSIGRKDNDKGYVPGNVTWQSATAQQNNQRDTITYKVDGKAGTATQQARRHGMPPTTVISRLERGVPMDDALKKEAAIDDFLDDTEEFSSDAQQRLQEYRGRGAKEMKIWEQYHQTKKPQHLNELLTSMKPLIRSEANKRLQGLGGSIPRAAVENELLTAAVKSIHSYDPNRGVKLTTHVTNGFRRFSDFAAANRNAKYMPAADMKRYDAFRNVTSELHNELGRPPTVLEIKTHAPHWNERTIKKMQRGFGRELYTDLGGQDTISISDRHEQLPPRQAFMLTRDRMTPEEVRFAQMYFPPEGEKQPSITNIAKALGVSSQRAYRIKANVETHVGRVLKRE